MKRSSWVLPCTASEHGQPAPTRTRRISRWACGVLAWLMILGGLGYAFLGCSAMYGQTPIRETLVMSHPVPVAYQHAVETLVQMGGTHMYSNRPDERHAGMVSGQVHGAVQLTVLVQEHPEGSLVQVTGSLLPDKLVLGKFDEVNQYVRLLQQVR